MTKVHSWAFRGAELVSFDWPADAVEIPQCCFLGSKIEQINGIENVESIGNYAFASTKIEKFSWPKKAAEIPPNCFEDSPLEHIEGIENVIIKPQYV